MELSRDKVLIFPLLSLPFVPRFFSLGSTLVRLSIQQMMLEGADYVFLETECVNTAAIALYEAIGFVRYVFLMIAHILFILPSVLYLTNTLV